MFTVGKYTVTFKRYRHTFGDDGDTGRYDTHCTIFVEGSEATFTGIANLHPNDQPDKVVGKKIALQNLLQPINAISNFGKGERTRIWQAFRVWVKSWKNQPGDHIDWIAKRMEQFDKPTPLTFTDCPDQLMEIRVDMKPVLVLYHCTPEERLAAIKAIGSEPLREAMGRLFDLTKDVTMPNDKCFAGECASSMLCPKECDGHPAPNVDHTYDRAEPYDKLPKDDPHRNQAGK